MTPLLTALKHGLNNLTDSVRTPKPQALDWPEGLSAHAVVIELRPSTLHTWVLGALATLSLTACLCSELPWFYCLAAGLWVSGSLLHWTLTPQPIHYLIDDGETWLLSGPHGTYCVNYQQADYCTANLLVMNFTSAFSKRIRVFVWSDAVTPAAFSWLTARMTLSDADAPVQNVSTSGPNAVFSFS